MKPHNTNTMTSMKLQTAARPAHTPGPWTQHRDSQGRVRIQGNVQGGPVAFIEELNNTGGTPQDHGNAALIAAAPDLLAALKGLFEHCAMIHRHWGENSNAKQADEAQALAKAAIAKAETH